jgi:hypothetical protein
MTQNFHPDDPHAASPVMRKSHENQGSGELTRASFLGVLPRFPEWLHWGCSTAESARSREPARLQPLRRRAHGCSDDGEPLARSLPRLDAEN